MVSVAKVDPPHSFFIEINMIIHDDTRVQFRHMQTVPVCIM